MSKPLKDLRGLVEADVLARHDALRAHAGVGTEDYRHELTRRQTAALLRLTRVGMWLTVVSTGATGVSLVLAALASFRPGRAARHRAPRAPPAKGTAAELAWDAWRNR